jgi:hypothetical protein
VTYPDRFAAIGPSAGWVSFASYGGGGRRAEVSEFEAMLRRAAGPSDTLALVRNLDGVGVAIVHGADDDNVPASEARTMTEALAAFHRDWTYHEQPQAGHWWDVSSEPGADCVDWAPLFDAFARRARPAADAVRHVQFTTKNPGVSARSHWVAIEAQAEPLETSTVDLRCDPGARRIQGTTSNVARLRLNLGAILAPGQPVTFELDGATAREAAWPATGVVVLARGDAAWEAVEPAGPDQKGPQRNGPFKEAFQHRFQLVYATGGTPEENAWALAKARYDAEVFGYRGNGSVDVVADTAFDPKAEPDRAVVVYGNADTHRAWSALLGGRPVEARRGGIRLGDREIKGEDLACLFIQPRPGSERALVAVVGGTGLPGLRLTDRLPCFTSGVGIPDLVVLGSAGLSDPGQAGRAAGFFGPDWGVESGTFTFPEKP